MKLHLITDPAPPAGHRRQALGDELEALRQVVPELDDWALTILASILVQEQQRRSRP